MEYFTHIQRLTLGALTILLAIALTALAHEFQTIAFILGYTAAFSISSYVIGTLLTEFIDLIS